MELNKQVLRAECRTVDSENLLEIIEAVHVPALAILAECASLPEIDGFLTTLRDCRALPVDDEHILQTVRDYEQREIQAMAARHLRVVRSDFVRSGAVTVMDESNDAGVRVVRIGPQYKDVFLHAFDEVASLSVSITHESPIDTGQEMRECALLFAGAEHSVQLSKAIAAMTNLMEIRGEHDGSPVRAWKPEYAESPECKKLLRAVRRMQDMLLDYKQDPSAFAQQSVVHRNSEIDERVEDTFTMYLLSYMSDAYEQLQYQIRSDKKRAKLERQQKHSANKREKDETAVVAVSSSREIGKTALQTSEDQSEWTQDKSHLVGCGEVTVKLPWTQSANQTNMTVMEYAGGKVYVIRAYVEGLSDIAQSARNHTTKSGGLPDSDKLLAKLARKVAAGVDPAAMHNSGIARLSKSLPVYGRSVWSNKGVFANSMRTYFVLKPVGEVVISDNDTIIDPDAQCMVVIAETEKKNQVPVLQKLTGQSYQSSRAKNAGAI